MKNFSKFFFLIFIAATLFTFIGCDKKDDGGNGPNDLNNPPVSVTAGNILGTVKGAYGSGLGDVTIKVGNLTTTSNDQGWFSIPEVPEGTRVQVKFEKNGYVATSEIINVVVGETTYIEVVMVSVGATQTVSTGGGTVTTNSGATVTFGSNAFSNNGSATVEATYFDPTSDYFEAAFPGDFTGNQNGTEGTLESFGFIDVKLKDANGNAVNLRSGQTAEIRIPIPYALQATAPNSIPLWYYDESAGIWRAEGTGTRVGNEYVGVVTHFTSWNWDRIYNVSYIRGRVIDGDGNPVNHAYVTADGVDYSGRSYRYTGSDGTFRMGVRPNSQVVVNAAKGSVTSLNSNVSTPADGQEYNMGDIVLSAPIATITLTWGETPHDLDSHLLVPAESGTTQGHVRWNSNGSLTYYPYAQLDTDDTNGYGPENITIVRKYTGTYQYYVYKYSSSGDIAQSGARITLLLGGNLYSYSVPTSNSSGYRYWHVFDLVVSSNGSIQLQSVNQLTETGPSASDMLMKK